jgi:hypothetical protein
MRDGSATRATRDPRRAEPAVVSVRDQRRRLARRVRKAVGFRVDGPEGRIGVLTAIEAGDRGDASDHIEVRTGLFIMRTARIPVADVLGVDPARHLVRVRTMPECPQATRHETARRVRRFVRTRTD